MNARRYYVVFLVTTSKRGVSPTELSRRLSLGQKPCYYFRRKATGAMQSSGPLKLTNKADVDEFVVGGYEKGKRGRSKGKRKQEVMGIEMKTKGIVRCYASQRSHDGTKELKPFFNKFVDNGAQVRTDKWRVCRPLQLQSPKLKQEKINPAQNF